MYNYMYCTVIVQYTFLFYRYWFIKCSDVHLNSKKVLARLPLDAHRIPGDALNSTGRKVLFSLCGWSSRLDFLGSADWSLKANWWCVWLGLAMVWSCFLVVFDHSDHVMFIQVRRADPGWYAPIGSTLGNSWRIGPDDTNWNGVLKNIDIMNGLQKYAGPPSTKWCFFPQQQDLLWGL